jgi:hypothetical protein
VGEGVVTSVDNETGDGDGEVKEYAWNDVSDFRRSLFVVKGEECMESKN